MSLTKEEKVILSAYTGVSMTKDFNAIHEYIEKILKRPVLTHELAKSEIEQEIREKSKHDFLRIINE